MSANDVTNLNRRAFLSQGAATAAVAASGISLTAKQSAAGQDVPKTSREMLFIDCETHAFPTLADRRDPTVSHVERLLASMDENGINKSYFMFYSASMLYPGQADSPNSKRWGPSNEAVWEYFLESWQRHKDRFYFFNITDPREPDCIKKLEQQLKLGLQGLGETQPASQDLLPDGPEYRRVYRFAADHGLPIVLTAEVWERYLTTKGLKGWDDVFDAFERIIREFKSVRFMLGHGGNCGEPIVRLPYPEYLAAQERCYRLMEQVDNLWLCVCLPWWHWQKFRRDNYPKLLEHLHKRLGFSKITWGSDTPYVPQESIVRAVRNAPGSEQQRAQLCGLAAEEFVTGKKPSSS